MPRTAVAGARSGLVAVARVVLRRRGESYFVLTAYPLQGFR